MVDLEKIKLIIKGEVTVDAEALEKYSRDASLFQIKPEVVVFPKDVADIKALVKFTAQENSPQNPVSLTARSAGTDMTGGPLSNSIVVEVTRHLNHIKEIGPDYAVTEPGVYYRDFEKETLKHNLIFPSYPASRELCAMGGIVANNSGGEKTLTYGKTEKYVEEIKMVLRDGNEYTFKPLTMEELAYKKKTPHLEGEIYTKIHNLIEKNYDLIQSAQPQVSKNSAGYYLWNVWDKNKGIFDLTKLIVGSQGTLGIITQAKIKLVKPKKYSDLLVIFMKDIKPLAEVVNHLLKFKPESLESYDDHTFKVALKFFGDIAKRLKGDLLTLAIKFLPEFWAVLTGGVPKLVMLAEFTGDDLNEVGIRIKAAQESLKEFNLKTKIEIGEEADKYWVVRRESFNLLRHHVKNMRTAPFIDDIIVRPEKLPEFLPRLYKILDEYKDLTYTLVGHVGDGNFHVIPLVKLSEKNIAGIVTELSDKVFSLVLEYGGSITAEHNDGLIRTPYLEKMFGSEIYNLFGEVKKIFDPDNIFNPGKKVGLTLEQSLKYLKVN